jgi:exodeoxyribonuclease VII small subunit
VNDIENMKFEEAMARLEESVRKLEGGSLPLDDAIKLYEEAIELVRICHGRLDSAERRIRILVEGEDGSVYDKPFGELDAN